jgi:hypothetical protein
LPPAAPRSFSATPSNCIVVKNLPQAHLALEELETEFSKFGAIMRRGQAADIQVCCHPWCQMTVFMAV